MASHPELAQTRHVEATDGRRLRAEVIDHLRPAGLPRLVEAARADEPFAHGRWLAEAIPGAQGEFRDHDGHLNVVAAHIGEVHEWLAQYF